MTDRDPAHTAPMSPDAARAALEDARRLQHRTREKYIDGGFRRPYCAGLSIGLIMLFSAFDVSREPWDRLLPLVANLLIFGTILLAQWRAPVRRKPSSQETGFTIALAALSLMAMLCLLILFKLIELPAPYTLTASVYVLSTWVFCRPLRRAYANVVHSS